MENIDYLIVGGGVAGTTAAEFIRNGDAQGSITIIMEEPETLYSRVMLPHYLRDLVPFERLYLRKPESYAEKGINLVKGQRASKVDTQNRRVYLTDGQELHYKKLLIATGGKVNKLDIPGKDLPGVTYLRTVKDVKEVRELMGKAKNAVVIGAGFIGIEYAQSFIKAGLSTTAVIREPYFWNRVVGDNSGKFINKILQDNGIKIVSEAETAEFVGDTSLKSVKLKSGQEIAAEIAGVGIGIHMDLDHLKESGLQINKGIVTNEFLESNVTDVWAAGDIAEFQDIVFAKRHQLGNWSNAAAQGKTVGPNMVAGYSSAEKQPFITVSAYTISIFQTPFTFLGDPVVDETTQVIERGSLEEGKLGRLLVRDDRLVGASLINLPAERMSLEKMIRGKTKITVSSDKLADTHFDLNSLVVDT
jgi:3-phenylpropionate/trans-cinnamate dioxygenase ferredoxin reductase subunit